MLWSGRKQAKMQPQAPGTVTPALTVTVQAFPSRGFALPCGFGRLPHVLSLHPVGLPGAFRAGQARVRAPQSVVIWECALFSLTLQGRLCQAEGSWLAGFFTLVLGTDGHAVFGPRRSSDEK